MKIKFVGILIIMILLAACASKQAVNTPEPPIPPTPPTVTEVSPVEATKPVETLLTPEEIAKGKTLYENNCAKCHKLFAPTAYTQKKWEPIMTRMQPKARLADAQMATIMNYITSELNKQ